MRRSVLLLVLALGCRNEPEPFETCSTDTDGDGTCDLIDCAPEDGFVHPGAIEACNGVDDDCDGELPQDEVEDRDGDDSVACEDCFDDDGTMFPGNPEVCDGVDNDCDGSAEGEQDKDDDGFLACSDCDDTDPLVRHDVPELACDGVDTNCDGVLANEEVDLDQDGQTQCDGDCRPNDATAWLGAEELCDGIDTDCVGGPSEEILEFDADSDGWFVCQGDCDDENPGVNPGIEEVCNDVDDDCDGLPFEDTDGTGEDTDLDGDGFAPCEGDCDDENASVHPWSYDVIGSILDGDCDGTPSGLSPGFGGFEGPFDTLGLVAAECALHGRVLEHVDFEAGPDGAAIAGLTELSLRSTLDDVDADLVFAALEQGLPAPEGALFARPTGGVDSIALLFNVPQTAVAFTLGVPGSAQPDTLLTSLVFDGTVVANGPSTASQVVGWTEVGYESLGGVAFNELFVHHLGGPELLVLDDLWYCR